MLRGSGDGLVDRLLVGRWVQELAAQVLQQAQRSGVMVSPRQPAAGPVKHGPDQRQAGALAGKPADDLHAPAGLAEGALDEVRVTDPVPVVGREPQVHRERGEVVGDTGDRGGVAAPPLRRELGRLAVSDGDGLIARRGVADIEMAQKSAFTSSWSWTDTLARVLRARWTRHRWRRLLGNARSKAPVSPGRRR
jgi:hypothetical protein